MDEQQANEIKHNNIETIVTRTHKWAQKFANWNYKYLNKRQRNKLATENQDLTQGKSL